MGGVSADGKVLWVSGRYNGVVYAIDTTTRCAAAQDPRRIGAARPVRVPAARPVLTRPHRCLPVVAVSRTAPDVRARRALLVSGCASGKGNASSPSTTRRPCVDIRPSTTAATTSTPTSTARRADRVGRSAAIEPALPMKIQEAGAASTGTVCTSPVVTTSPATAVRPCSCSTDPPGSAGPSLPIAVNHPGVAAIGGDVYVAGGFTPGGATNRVFVLAAGAELA